MKKMILAVVASAVALSGCASLVSNRTEPMIVRTTCGDAPVQGATCRMMNSKGSWQVTTPGATMIAKGPGDLAVSCGMPGVVGDPVLQESHAALGAWGNLIGPGWIGWTFDAYNDNAWRYSSQVTVDICRGQPDRVVKQIQSAAADVGGTTLVATPDNTPALARMTSLLPGERKWSVVAENVAKERQCAAHPQAVLSARGPATEVYTVPCGANDPLMLKCTWGECKVI